MKGTSVDLILPSAHIWTDRVCMDSRTDVERGLLTSRDRHVVRTTSLLSKGPSPNDLFPNMNGC